MNYKHVSSTYNFLLLLVIVYVHMSKILLWCRFYSRILAELQDFLFRGDTYDITLRGVGEGKNKMLLEVGGGG